MENKIQKLNIPYCKTTRNIYDQQYQLPFSLNSVTLTTLCRLIKNITQLLNFILDRINAVDFAVALIYKSF